MRVEKYLPRVVIYPSRWLVKVRDVESLWLAGALLVALALKAGLLVANVLPFNADEAVVALMARHILQGEHPVFFYGQAYMGSLDAYLGALGFAVFGESVWVLRFAQIFLFLGTLATTTELGKESLGSRQAGVLASWLLAIPAVNVTLYTTVTLGGYGEMLLLGNLILLAALRIATNLGGSKPPPRRAWLAFGFLTGLGLWAFGMTLVYSLPAALYVAWSARKAGPVTDFPRLRMPPLLHSKPDSKKLWIDWVRWVGWILVGFLVGAAPWWGYALANGPRSLISEMAGSAIAGVDGSPYAIQVARHIFNLVVLGIPAVFGMRPPWEVRLLALPLLPFALAFWLGVGAFSISGLVRPVRVQNPMGARLPGGLSVRESSAGLSQTPFCRQGILQTAEPSSSPRWLLAGMAATLFAGFMLTPFGVDSSGRYFLPLAVVMALFGAETVLYVRRAWGRWAYGLVGLVLAFNAWGTLECALLSPLGLTTQFDAQTRIDHRYDPALVQFLLENGETTGYSTYWVAYPLAFLSKEALIFVPALPYHLDLRYTPRDNRYEPYARKVANAERAAYITANHPALDHRMRERFASMKVSWKEQQIGDYRVYYGLSRHVRPDELALVPLPSSVSRDQPFRFVR